MFDRLAEELKAARIKNDISLKQLSTRTRIDIKFLEAIEEGNFSFLPEIYVKAFIKEYASVVGLNSDIILKKYEAAKEGLPIEDITEEKAESKIESNEPVEEKTPPARVKNVEPPKEKIHEQKEIKPATLKSEEKNSQQTPVFDSTSSSPGTFKSTRKNTYLIAGIIGSVIVLAGLIYLIFFKSSNEIIVTEKPYDQVIAESHQRYEEKPSTAVDSTQNQIPLSDDSLHLVIQTTDTSWVKIIVDNSKAEEFILFPKAQKSLAANTDFRITFGRSSAIKLQLNNKPLEFKPKSKSVSYVLINSKGLEFLEKPPAKGND